MSLPDIVNGFLGVGNFRGPYSLADWQFLEGQINLEQFITWQMYFVCCQLVYGPAVWFSQSFRFGLGAVLARKVNLVQSRLQVSFQTVPLQSWLMAMPVNSDVLLASRHQAVVLATFVQQRFQGNPNAFLLITYVPTSQSLLKPRRELEAYNSVWQVGAEPVSCWGTFAWPPKSPAFEDSMASYSYITLEEARISCFLGYSEGLRRKTMRDQRNLAHRGVRLGERCSLPGAVHAGDQVT